MQLAFLVCHQPRSSAVAAATSRVWCVYVSGIVCFLSLWVCVRVSVRVCRVCACLRVRVLLFNLVIDRLCFLSIGVLFVCGVVC